MTENPLLQEWARAMLPAYEQPDGPRGLWLLRSPPEVGLAAIAQAKELPRLEPDEMLRDIYSKMESKYSAAALAESVAWGHRRSVVRTHAWAIPTDEAIDAIVKHSPAGVVEIGAGGGYWAGLIRARGVEVAAYDSKPYESFQVEARWSEVKRGGPKMVRFHPEKSLLLCWPPYSSPMAFDALSAYTGATLLYVGEGSGGCTGDKDFHDALEEQWEEIECVGLPQWPGIHDELYIYRRR